MNQGLLDSRLKNYFEQEAGQTDISTKQWQQFVGDATKYNQQSFNGIVRNLSNYFGASKLAAVAAVIAVLIVSGISIFISETWDSNVISDPVGATGAPSRPGNSGVTGGPGSPGIPGAGAVEGTRYFKLEWDVGSRTYIPGEPITAVLTLRNIHTEAIIFDDITLVPWQPHAGEISLYNGKSTGGPNSISLAIPGDIPELLAAAEQLEIPITIPPEVSSNLATGKYSIYLNARFRLAGEFPVEDAVKDRGSSSDTLFVILPPDGALIKTLQSGEVREVAGVKITLVALDFGPEEAKISAVINLPGRTGYSTSSVGATAVPEPTTAASTDNQDPNAPHPAATPAPREPGSDIRQINARYRVDGEIWELLLNFERSGADAAVFVERTIGPIPQTAKTFDFSITEMKIIPDDDASGPWEWSIPLTDE